MWARIVLGLTLCTLALTPIAAAEDVLRVKTSDGQVGTTDLLGSLERCAGVHLGSRWLPNRTLSVTRLAGASGVRALDAALGDAFDIAADDEHLTVTFDAAALPSTSGQRRAALRTVVTELRPGDHAQRLQHYGLHLPPTFNSQQPLVVLAHGFNSNQARWHDLAMLLEAEGHQVGYFNYANDQSIENSGQHLADALSTFRQQHPESPLQIIAHSMGGLVARWAIEGSEAPHVQRLILIAPPNHGAKMRHLTCVAELQEHHALQQTEADWNWTWPITDGLNEAGSQLASGSRFLTDLNRRPRKPGTQYTVIAGNKNSSRRYAAIALTSSTAKLPSCAGTRWIHRSVNRASNSLQGKTGDSDGAVSVASTRLGGVDDHVVLPGDHTTLYCSRNGQPPVAWQTIRDRLAASPVAAQTAELGGNR